MFEVEEIYDFAGTGLDYVETTVQTLSHICTREGPGDILAFLPGQGDIEKVQTEILRRVPGKYEIVLCFGLLSLERQNEIFKQAKPGYRKVALATNVAETSITIPGIVYVVDCGFFKQSEYYPKTGVEELKLKRITQAQAIQRKGRAGRTAPGKVYRLYSKQELDRFNPSRLPEIQRSNLESVVLQLLVMGFKEIFNFDFMDTPRKDAVCEALEKLEDLGAINDRLEVTPQGKDMAQFPLDPTHSKILIRSSGLKCSSEIIVIVAFMSVANQNLFSQDDMKDNRQLVNARMKQFHHPDGDQLMYLNVYDAWRKAHCDKDWCGRNMLNAQYLEEVENIVEQLKDILNTLSLTLVSCGSANDLVRQALCSGFFRQIACRNLRDKFSYNRYPTQQSYGAGSIFIHPSSSLFPRKPSPGWVLYAEMFKTSKMYIKGVCIIQPEWISDAAPAYCRKMGVLCREFTKLR